MPTLAVTQYERHKTDMRDRMAEKYRRGRELFPLPAPKSLERRKAALLTLQAYCELYRKPTFFLPWSKDQLAFVHYLEHVIRFGGYKIQAMARGDGKTRIGIAAAEWGVLNGFRQFVVFLGSTALKGVENMQFFKETFYRNELLAEDFPEVCYPLQKIGSAAQSRPLYLGKELGIVSTVKELRLPQIPGSVCAGATFYSDGLLAEGLRGLARPFPNGETVRPDLVIPDDPQNDESARSMKQTSDRMSTIKGSVLGMAGPKRSIALIGAVTVIAQNDLAAQLLNRDINPAFNGTRCQFLSKCPEGPLWDQYWQLRANCLRMGDQAFTEATDFYKSNRAEMDAGIVENSPHRFNDSEISATQQAANIIQDRGRAAFFAEFQNDPLSIGGDVVHLKSDDLREKLNGIKRGAVPDWASVLVLDIDVQDNLLFWLVKAGGTNGDRAVVDYGFFPDQNRRHFAVREVRHTLSHWLAITKRKGVPLLAGGAGDDLANGSLPVNKAEAMYAGLMRLTNDLFGRTWKREHAGPINIRLGTIDAQDGDHWKIVYQVCRESPHRALLLPRHGLPVKASDRPVSISWKKNLGDEVGDEWVRGPCKKEFGRQDRLLIDVNYWKTQSQNRWLTGKGANGCATLFGRDFDEHGMFADHRTAEFPTRVTAEGKWGKRVADEWSLFPGRTENHFLDLDVATDAGLSACGIRVLDETVPIIAPRRRVTHAQYYGRRR